MSDLWLMDLGSSRLKWQVRSTAGEVLARGGSDWPGASPQPLLPVQPPEQIWLSHVGPGERAQALLAWVRQRFGEVVVQQARPLVPGPLGLSLDYDPSQLGADRYCALLGVLARSRQPSVVIDAGTAVTVDGLAADGRHLGGFIVPGLRAGRSAVTRLLSSALRDRVERSVESVGEPAQMPGHGTAEALARGWTLGLAGAVERLAETVAGGSTAQWWLTGGDAEQIAPLMQYPVTVEPELVLEGLWVHAQHAPNAPAVTG